MTDGRMTVRAHHEKLDAFAFDPFRDDGFRFATQRRRRGRGRDVSGRPPKIAVSTAMQNDA